MYDILRRKNSGLKDQVVDFAQQLVRKPSPSLQEREIADLVRKQMEIIGYDRIIQDDCGNIVGIMFGREIEPTLLLNCHMDTISPAEQDQWSNEPFSGQIKDGKLHGCGASDCKGGLAAQIFAGALLKRSLLPLNGNLIVAATVGEEQGASVGIRGLIERTLPELELNPTYAILGEPTELGLYYGHDGWAEMDIKIEDTTAMVRKVTNAWAIDPFCPLMERSRHALEAANCQVRPGKWNLGRVGMATAGGVLTKDYKIPTIGYGPGNEEVIHGPNEYVEVDKIIEAVYGTAAIAHSLIGVPVFGWTSDDI